METDRQTDRQTSLWVRWQVLNDSGVVLVWRAKFLRQQKQAGTTMPSSNTQPLAWGQKILLQRLLAAHVLTDAKAKKLFAIVAGNDQEMECETLAECWSEINAQLSPSFGLEVATVSINGKLYHALINQNTDNIAKQSFQNLKPNTRAYVRKVLETLSTSESIARMDLVNLRIQVPEPFQHLEMDEAGRCLDELLDENWLMAEGPTNRRSSMSQEYKIGPRSYLELSHLLNSFGLDDLPQFIFHRK